MGQTVLYTLCALGQKKQTNKQNRMNDHLPSSRKRNAITLKMDAKLVFSFLFFLRLFYDFESRNDRSENGGGLQICAVNESPL